MGGRSTVDISLQGSVFSVKIEKAKNVADLKKEFIRSIQASQTAKLKDIGLHNLVLLTEYSTALTDDLPIKDALEKAQKSGLRAEIKVIGALPLRAALSFFLIMRIIAAAITPVSDCDETFNYWEPTHYLMYGKGLQTWEYSPEFSIRSYSYILLHSSIGWLIQLVFGSADKLLIWYGIRAGLAIISSVCETVFYGGVSHRFGARVANLTLAFMLFSSGCFHANVAFLPSSFSLYGVLLAFGFWFAGRLSWAVAAAASAVLWGWPFVAIVFAPLGLDVMLRSGFLKFLAFSLWSLVAFLTPIVLIDHYFYKRWLVAVWNIVSYNATSGGDDGGQLYGVEPWTYYFVNLFLNFNVVFCLAIWSLPAALLFRKFLPSIQSLPRLRILAYLVPPFLWMAFFLYLPHKEERFMFVIYPLICLGAAIVLALSYYVLHSVIHSVFHPKLLKKTPGLILLAISLVFILMSASRNASLLINYHAPIDVYTHLSVKEFASGRNDSIPAAGDINVCVGKEWYRFPSNFFLPGQRFHVRFIKNSFDGQLPQPYQEVDGTSVIPSGFNDKNREELSRYIALDECHYVVDFEIPDQKEQHFLRDPENWKLVAAFPFLDAGRSNNSLTRAFWVPTESYKHNVFGSYFAVRNRKLIP